MGEVSQFGRTPRPAAHREAELSPLLDPRVLERRLAEARLRRAEALAGETERPPTVLRPQPAGRRAEIAPPEGAPGAPLAQPRRRKPAAVPRRRRAPIARLFAIVALGGLGLGIAGTLLRPWLLPPEPALVVGVAGFDVAPAAPAQVSAPATRSRPAIVAPAKVAAIPAKLAQVAAPALTAGPAVELPLPVAEPPSPPAGNAALHLVVHAAPGTDKAVAAAESALRAAGFASLDLSDTAAVSGASNVRYFHPEDLAAAKRVSGLLAAADPGNTPEVRDFTDLRPAPAPGTLAVWLAGTPRHGAPTARRSSRPSRAVAPQSAAGPLGWLRQHLGPAPKATGFHGVRTDQ